MIAGTARHLPLKTIEGLDTRPTTDRIKETLFNMLHADLPGARFLDLFSGSGGIGIEALSRGAAWAGFAEKAPAAVRCIKENLQFTHLEDRAQVFACDVLSAISQLESTGKPVDFIFMDPPYGKELEKQVLTRLAHSPLADADTTIIVEANLETDFYYVDSLGYDILKQKQYKTNQHLFLQKKSEQELVL